MSDLFEDVFGKKKDATAQPAIAVLPTSADWETTHRMLQKHGLPPAVAKATLDPFDYAVGLRDGSVIQFEQCSFDIDNPTFVTLKGIGKHTIPGGNPFTFDRGLDVRIADIIWASDAPHGS